MSSAITSTISALKNLRITARDLRVFVVTSILFSSVAVGAVTLNDKPVHNSSVAMNSNICSSAKYFR